MGTVMIAMESTPETAEKPVSATLANLAAQVSRAVETEPALERRLAIVEQSLQGRMAFSTSLGLEDQVLHHALIAAKLPVEVFTLDTGRHFPETYETVARTERAFATRIKVVAPDAKQVEALVAGDGIFGFRNSVEARKACCNVRKVQPLNRELAGAAVWFTGVRREQSSSRDATPFAEVDAALNLIKVNPLADWSLAQIEAYVRNHRVPVNPLHALGYPSIGCQPCTRAVAPGEPIRAGRWWWENEEQKECGLHFRPPRTAAAALANGKAAS